MWSFFSKDTSKEFPYEIHDKFYEWEDELVFVLYNGISKTTKEKVTIFKFTKEGRIKEDVEIAQHSVYTLKTVKHPNILKYLYSIEDNDQIIMVTERICPLIDYFDLNKNTTNDCIAWGILSIAKAIDFLHNTAKFRHNNLFSASVFVNETGEWKLGDLGFVTSIETDYPEKPGGRLYQYCPPEFRDQSSLKDIPFWSIDSWGLGILIWEIYNGRLTNSKHLKKITKIPVDLQSTYCGLVAAKPHNRRKPKDLLDMCNQTSGFFSNNIINVLYFLENIHQKDKDEITKFFDKITDKLDRIPSSLLITKVLPQMITSFSYGCDGALLIDPVLKISKMLGDEEYHNIVLPFLLKLFHSTDRATRSLLLKHIDFIADRLNTTVINDQLFPLILNGFLDTSPRIREDTVKAMVPLAPHLSLKNLHQEVLKHFARLQARDEQGGIRANTTVCLGKLAYCINPSERKKILMSGFLRSMNDNFAPVRNAGVLGLAVTQQFFGVEEISIRILPALCFLTVDTDKTVRDNTFRTIKGFLSKLEKVSEDPNLRDTFEKETLSTNQQTASWAGWAVAAVSSKIFNKSNDAEQQKSEGKLEIQVSKNSDTLPVTKKKEVVNPQPFDEKKEPVDEKKEPLDEKSANDYNDWDEDSWIPLEDTIIEPIPPVLPSSHSDTGPMKLSSSRNY